MRADEVEKDFFLKKKSVNELSASQNEKLTRAGNARDVARRTENILTEGGLRRSLARAICWRYLCLIIPGTNSNTQGAAP